MNLKRAAAKALAAHLEAAIPALAGKVHTVSAEPEEYAAYPSLYILPGKMTPELLGEEEVDDSAEDTLLVEIGDWTGTWELRIPGKTPLEREELEQQVLDAFFAREGAGALIEVSIQRVVAGGVTTQHTATASFGIDASEWSEEFSFSKKRFSFLDVSAEIPILVLRTNIPTINELILGESDLDGSNLEEVEVLDDGDDQPDIDRL